MNLKKQLYKETRKIDSIIQKVEEHIKTNCVERLRCTTSNNAYQYFINGKYVPSSEKDRARNIAQQEYERKLYPKLRSLKKTLQILNSFYNEETLESVYQSMCKGKRLLVTPYFPDKEEYIKAWISQEYDHWDIKEESGFLQEEAPEKRTKNSVPERNIMQEPSTMTGRIYSARGEFYTLKGERVRSKSEKIIADEFTRFEIPYHYEYPLDLRQGNQIRTVRPDFIVLNTNTLQEFVVEHLGMMDKEEYNNRTINKLDLYEKNGYLLGKNLLIFHETSSAPLNMSVIDQYIQEYLL